MTRIAYTRDIIPPVKKATKRKKLRQFSKEWRARQPKVCPVCQLRDATEEHHIIRKGMGGSLLAECEANWILICEQCHRYFHAGHITLACVLYAKRYVDGFVDVDRLAAIRGQSVPEVE